MLRWRIIDTIKADSIHLEPLMIFSTIFERNVFDHARSERQKGSTKKNIFPAASSYFEAYELGWRITDEAFDLIKSWYAMCRTASKALSGHPLAFQASMDMDRHRNGPVTFVEAIITSENGNYQFDVETLPFYWLKGEDGELFVASEEELDFADDAEKAEKLIAVIALSFGAARQQGFIDPADLIINATDEIRAGYKRLLDEFAHIAKKFPDESFEPCRFCGAEITKEHVRHDQIEHNSFAAIIDCPGCEISITGQYGEDSEEKAVSVLRKLWNRHPEDKQPDEDDN